MLEGFFEQSLDLLFVAEGDGTFRRVNPAFTDVLGYPREEVVGRPMTDIVHGDDLSEPVHWFDELADEPSTAGFETRVETRDGSERWLAWRLAWAPERKLVYGSAREISRPKQVDRLKREFVSVVSHELRTPLTSVRGALRLALKDDELDEQTRHLLEMADQNSERLERLVDDILDIEKIESGDLEFEFASVDPAEVVEEVAEAHRSYADEYDVDLRVDAPDDLSPVRVDPDRLVQVLTNLVSNAIKYSPEGGTARLRAAEAGGRVRMSVADDGPGIPEEFRDRIFEKFTQADASTTRQRGGSGLGLSIARALAEQMGGTIDFETELGEGTLFWVDFPTEKAET